MYLNQSLYTTVKLTKLCPNLKEVKRRPKEIVERYDVVVIRNVKFPFLKISCRHEFELKIKNHMNITTLTYTGYNKVQNRKNSNHK